MKRCPTCQRIYADDTLRFCLEDGTALFGEATADTDRTLLMDSSQAGEEPPPTEILDYSIPPTVLAQERDATPGRKKPAPTVRQQGRPTVNEFPNPAAPASLPRQRSTTSVVAVTVVATVLLLGVGGLGAWLILKDKNNSGGGTEPPRAGNNSNNASSNNTGGPSTGNSNTTKAGSPTPTATPTRTPTPSTSPSPTPTPQTNDPAVVRREVTQALDGWAETMGRLDAHMAYYASTLHTYYLQSNVSSARVRAIIAPAFSKYKTFDVKLSKMQIDVDPSGTSAVATFDKTFTFSGDSTYSGSGLNRFWLEKINGRWLITGEKDLKTYYINK